MYLQRDISDKRRKKRKRSKIQKEMKKSKNNTLNNFFEELQQLLLKYKVEFGDAEGYCVWFNTELEEGEVSFDSGEGLNGDNLFNKIEY